MAGSVLSPGISLLTYSNTTAGNIDILGVWDRDQALSPTAGDIDILGKGLRTVPICALPVELPS